MGKFHQVCTKLWPLIDVKNRFHSPISGAYVD